MKKFVNISFIALIMIFLLSGFVRTVFFPKDINSFENRAANKIEDFTVSEYLTGTYQTQVANALNDQVTLSVSMKRLYNYLNSYYEDWMIACFLEDTDAGYISFRGGYRYEDHLVIQQNDYDAVEEQLSLKVDNISQVVSEHPEIAFYAYYIERDVDIDFETGEKTASYRYLQDEFLQMDVPFERFEIDGFSDYKEYFFRTDHHWNCYGSYKAYKEILEMLDKDHLPLEPTEECLLDYEYAGSRALTMGANELIYEKFPAYRFEYPEMDITVNGKPADDYGMQDVYLDMLMSTITYGLFYGGDNGETIFDTHNPEKDNLLVLGESYDNAVLKLIASHFDKTYSVDLRNYEYTFGESFNFSDYVLENEIDKVLLIGNEDFYTMDAFMLED